MTTATDGPRTILVVDDFDDTRLLLRTWLERRGFRVIEAANGLQAINQAETEAPDLIIMDLGMPAMAGDQATARLKADPSTRDIPVIVTTAFSYGPLIDRAISAGADEIMHKPFTLKLLRAAMQRHLSLDYQRPASP